MAKSVADLIVDLKIDGIEGVNVLKSSLIALGKAAGPTDKNIRKIRTEILEFANAGQKSTQAVKGVVESFKGLQAQASIGSSVYRQLAADVESLEADLKSLSPEAQKAAKAIRAFGPSKVPDAFVEDMKERRRQLKGIAVDSDKYLEKLVAIKNFEAQQAARVGRQEVSAAARVARTGIYSNIVESDQPATLAALRLRIGEVQNEIENLDFTTNDYADANKELIALQKSLSEALGGTSSSFDRLGDAQTRAARRAEKLAGIQSASAGAIGTRDPRTGAMIAGGAGAPASLVQRPVREISGLYQSIGSVGMAGISADIDRMGKSYGEVANDIKKATLASNGSIRSLEAQRNSWASLRAGLDPASKGYREVGREIDKVDKRLARLNKRRGFSAKGAAQTVGAVASAGIFGGPLGAAGALGGAAIGGAAGAAVGGGIGASVGILAQQVSGFTDYAASIRLSEKALKRLITVEGNRIQTAKNEAVATQVIEYAVAKLNVERADATIGMTRLSAAVLGAGGNIETAGLAFLGATKAIKATKGSAEDVRGGLTALVQMFSKGKISAEELSGQLGERFPAAVTAFADANGISTQELQKMLKNGEVGLDKLVNFLQFAVKKYSDGALEMAASSEESGQRQTIAFQEVRRQLGEQLVSVGSELQQSITKALKDLTPAIVNIAKATAQGIKTIINGIALLITHFDKIKDLIVLIVGATVGGKALSLIVTISTRILPLIRRVGLLRAAILILNRTLLLNPLYLLAAGVTAAGIAISDYVGRHDNFIKGIENGTTSIEDARAGIRKYEEDLQKLQTRKDVRDGTLPEVKQKRPGGIDIQVDDIVASGQQPQILDNQIKAIEKTITAAKAKLKQRIEGSKPLSEQLAGEDFLAELLKGAKIPGLDLDPSGDGTGDEKVKMTQAELGLRRQLRTAQASQNELLAAEVQLAIDSLAAKAETEDLVKATNMEEQANATYAKAVNDIYKKRNELMQSANVEMQNARFAVTLMSQEERQRIEINRQLAEFAEKYAGAMSSEELANALRELRSNLEEANSAAFKFKKGLREIFNEAINVTESISELGVSAVEGLGDAFAEFVTTGKANFRDFANSVISDLARIFAKKALFGALGAIPGVGSFLGLGGGGSGGDELNIEGIQAYMNANGNVFAKNKIVPYAYGGVVNKPTLFPMANGAGLMGEAGPEAIMPLRRGANGKLGVEASGSGVGDVVVNVDAAGSSVEGNGDQAAQLGKAIGIAVQQELIKQKRPGGLLTS